MLRAGSKVEIAQNVRASLQTAHQTGASSVILEVPKSRSAQALHDVAGHSLIATETAIYCTVLSFSEETLRVTSKAEDLCLYRWAFSY